jgi:cyclase
MMLEAGKRKSGLEPVTFAKQMEDAGAGEILLNSVDRDGTMQGYDLELIRSVASAISIPLIACGGAGSIEDLGRAVIYGGASAVAAGSIFVFHGRHRAVLINFPKRSELERTFT